MRPIMSNREYKSSLHLLHFFQEKGVKNILLTSTAKYLPDKVYVKYIIVINHIYTFFRKSYPRITIKSEPSVDLGSTTVDLWRVEETNRVMITPSAHRLSRFLKGFEYASSRQWERYGIDALLNGEKPDAVIDIGANVGEFTNACIMRDYSEIHSFEPDPIAFHCLRANIEPNLSVLNNVALGESNGSTTFYSSPMDADSSLIQPQVLSYPIEVTMQTLDDYILRNKISGRLMLKMDAEGAEPQVLRGLASGLMHFNWLAIDVGPENNGKDTISEVGSILVSYGFKTELFDTWILHARK